MKNKRLNMFRKSKQLCLKEISYILGVSQSYYEKVEYGKRNASGNFVKKMIDAFPEDKAEILNMFF